MSNILIIIDNFLFSALAATLSKKELVHKKEIRKGKSAIALRFLSSRAQLFRFLSITNLVQFKD